MRPAGSGAGTAGRRRGQADWEAAVPAGQSGGRGTRRPRVALSRRPADPAPPAPSALLSLRLFLGKQLIGGERLESFKFYAAKGECELFFRN